MDVQRQQLSASRQGAHKRVHDLWSLGVLPVLAVGAFSGLIGIYWDIAWHIDKGRDSFFTAPHNFIYIAIAIVLATSLYALWRDRRDTPLHLAVGRFRLHPGVLIVAIGAGLELFFAPADDLWHRLFGADATLWAPMHLIGLTGLILASFGGLITAWIERRLTQDAARKRLFGRLTLFFAAALLAWSMLILAEYEFNIPAFPMVWHPLLLTALPSFALVLVARLNPTRWSGTLTALLFQALRVLFALWLMTTDALDLAGATRPAIPLLLFAGVAADLLRERPAWLVGLAVGVMSLLPNAALILALGSPNWYPAALWLGVPGGLLLAPLFGVLGARTAAALEPGRGDTRLAAGLKGARA